MPSVTVHNDFYPDDEDIEIPGLGSVPNNSTTEVSEAQVQLFKYSGYDWPEDGHLVIEVKDLSLEELEQKRSEATSDDPFVRRADGSIDWEASDVPTDMVIGTTSSNLAANVVVDGAQADKNKPEVITIKKEDINLDVHEGEAN